MDGDKCNAGRLGAARQFRRIAAAVIPAQPHFQRNRHFDGPHHRFDQTERVIQIAHQRRSGLAVGDVLGGAAHVDIDDRGAGGFRDAGAFGHPMRFAAGELDDVPTATLALDAPLGTALARGKCRTSGHFRDDQTRTQRLDLTPKWGVGDAGHWRQKHRIRYPHRPDSEKSPEFWRQMGGEGHMHTK